jgi:transcriptional regulator with XRE-family HTH domain
MPKPAITSPLTAIISSHPTPAVSNRLRSILYHIPWYSIEGIVRLAKDTGLSTSTISRLVGQKNSPSYRVAETIASVISQKTGIPIETNEIFSPTGNFPTPSVCNLMGCKGCLPPEAWNEATDSLKENWRHAKPREWAILQGNKLKSSDHKFKSGGQARLQTACATGLLSLT